MEHKDLQCPICYELFNNTSAVPRILTVCGHTICTSCLRSFSTNQLVSDCPVCKQTMPPISYSSLAVNFALKNIAESSSNWEFTPCLPTTSGPCDVSSKRCIQHRLPKDFRCDSCEEWICPTCGMNEHRTCETRPATEAVHDVTQSLLSQVSNIVSSTKASNNLISSQEYQKLTMKKITDKMSQIQIMQSLIKSEEQEIKKLNDDMSSTSESNFLALQILKTLEKSSTKLTDSSISFNSFLNIESEIQNQIRVLTDIMSSNEELCQDMQSLSLVTTDSERKQQLINKLLVEATKINKKLVIQCVTDSASLPMLLDVEVKESRIFISSCLHYHPNIPEIQAPESIVKSLSQRICFTLTGGHDGRTLGDVHIIKGIPNDPLVDFCLGLVDEPQQKIKMIWTYDGWLSTSVLVHNPGFALCSENYTKESRIWKEGEVSITVGSDKKKKIHNKFRLQLCSSQETQFEHERINFGDIVEGSQFVKEAFERSRKGEPIFISKLALVCEL